MQKKLIFCMVFLVLLVGTISAYTIYKQHDCITLSFKSDATNCNLSSIRYPNSSISESNILLTNIYGEFNVSTCNTQEIGIYEYGGMCDVTPWNKHFEITPTGESLTTGGSILYLIFIVVNLLIIVLSLYFIFILPGENEKDNRGVVIGIVRLKYLRVILIGLFYGLLIVLLNFLNGLATNFPMLSMFSGMIGFSFKVLLSLAWLFSLVMCIWIVYMLVQDSNFKKHISKITRGPF